MTSPCPRCTATMPPSARFCGECGWALRDDSDVEVTTVPRSQLDAAAPPSLPSFPPPSPPPAPPSQLEPGVTKRRSPSRTPLLVLGGVLAVALLAGLGYAVAGFAADHWGLSSSTSVDGVPDDPAPESKEGLTTGQDAADPATTPTPGYPTPQPRKAPAQVVSDSPGEGCDTLSRQEWGDYYPARCKMWQPSQGLLTQTPLGKGPRVVTCQADLGKENPVFTARQRNTWWVWIVTEDGTMDWFPETAVSQGASGLPIRGVSVCEL